MLLLPRTDLPLKLPIEIILSATVFPNDNSFTEQLIFSEKARPKNTEFI